MQTYKEHGLTRKDREQQQIDIIQLRPYILALKQKAMGFIGCEQCKTITNEVDIHYTSYKHDLTYYDLMLLCIPCHTSMTDYRPMSMR